MLVEESGRNNAAMLQTATFPTRSRHHHHHQPPQHRARMESSYRQYDHIFYIHSSHHNNQQHNISHVTAQATDSFVLMLLILGLKFKEQHVLYLMQEHDLR